MKYKVISLFAVAFLLLAAAAATVFGADAHERVHQHLAQPAKPPCTHGADVFCSSLPIISFETGGKEPQIQNFGTVELKDYRSDSIVAQVKIYDTPTLNNHLTDAPAVTEQALIKYRGNSSLYFDKKSYKMDFVEENLTEDRDVAVMGMAEDDNWVLNGPFLDKTLMRNYLCLNISGELMRDAPDVRYCELFVNGEYRGVYLAMESVSRGEDRVNISAYQEGDAVSSYILRFDRETPFSHGAEIFSKYAAKIGSNTSADIDYPAEDVLPEPLVTYITQDFSRFEKALYSFDYDDSNYGYPSYIDKSSFVDYFILNEFFMNVDAGTFSTQFYKDLRGKIHAGPVWDFNNACDNYMETSYDGTGFTMVKKPRFVMLVKDDRFIESVIARYRDLRKTVLNEEYLLNYIDQTEAFLGDAVSRNYAVWGYSFDPNKAGPDQRLFPLDRNPPDYSAAVGQLKTFIQTRGAWMDKNIELLRQYCHESKNKKFNH